METLPSLQHKTGFSGLRNWLSQPTDGATLGTFRSLFGIVLFLETALLLFDIDAHFPSWEFRPTYGDFLAWHREARLPYFLTLSIQLLAAAGLAMGFCVRWSAGLFCLAFCYDFLLDPSHFNNHYYLIGLLAFWLGVVDSGKFARLEFRGTGSPWVPRWHLEIVRFHVTIAYLFGGINKVNSDWLSGEPMRQWAAVEANRPVIGPWMALPETGLFFAYAGLVFDLTIPFLLLWRRTRVLAIVATLAFHLTNTWLFDIGAFPYLMIAANVLYLEPETPRRWWKRLLALFAAPEKTSLPGPIKDVAWLPMNRWLVSLLAIYIGLQFTLPFRHLAYDGWVEWTEEGKNFSWRMMLTHKDCWLRIRVVDPETNTVWRVDHEQHLSGRQNRGKGVRGNPRLLAQYARFLKEQAIEEFSMKNPRVYAECLASINGRPYQFLVDPQTDLATAELSWWQTPKWIVPLKEAQSIGDYAVTPDEKVARIRQVLIDYRAAGHEFPGWHGRSVVAESQAIRKKES